MPKDKKTPHGSTSSKSSLGKKKQSSSTYSEQQPKKFSSFGQFGSQVSLDGDCTTYAYCTNSLSTETGKEMLDGGSKNPSAQSSAPPPTAVSAPTAVSTLLLQLQSAKCVKFSKGQLKVRRKQ